MHYGNQTHYKDYTKIYITEEFFKKVILDDVYKFESAEKKNYTNDQYIADLVPLLENRFIVNKKTFDKIVKNHLNGASNLIGYLATFGSVIVLFICPELEIAGFVVGNVLTVVGGTATVISLVTVEDPTVISLFESTLSDAISNNTNNFNFIIERYMDSGVTYLKWSNWDNQYIYTYNNNQRISVNSGSYIPQKIEL